MFVTLTSFKGGVGKSTTALHLAAQLQRSGKTVLIDADPNRSATAWTNRGSFPFDIINEFQLNKIASGQYTHIVMDTAARPSADTMKLLVEGCDLLILPTTPDLLSLDALRLTIESVRGFNADKFKILITMVRPNTRDGEHAQAMLRENGLPVFDGMIRRYQSFVVAASLGVLVSDVKDERSHFGAADYQAVGKELLS